MFNAHFPVCVFNFAIQKAFKNLNRLETRKLLKLIMSYYDY